MCRHSRAAALAAAEQRAAQELPFTPQLFNSRKTGVGSCPEATRQQTVQRLSQPRTAHWQRCKASGHTTPKTSWERCSRGCGS